MATPAQTTGMNGAAAAPVPAVVVDVRTIHAHDEGSSLDSGASSLGHVGADGAGFGGSIKAAVRDYCLSCVPPHIRRKGLAIPPFRSLAAKSLGLLSLPYFPWAAMPWSRYPELAASDVLAGLTVGIMLVPQGMAYAQLSSLPPIYGLYASTIAGYVYTLFGTSGQLTIGPVALVSLFMSETYTKLGVPLTLKDKDPALNAQAQYHTYVRCELAAVVSFAAALLLLSMALLRIGSLMKLISPSVLTGFVTGSGVYIFLTQSKYIWGFKLPRDTVQIHELQYLFKHIPTDGDKYAMFIGITAFFAMWFFNSLRKGLQPRIRAIRRERPWAANAILIGLSASTLVIIVIATLVSYSLVKAGKTVSIIGDVPAGFNKFQWPALKNDFYGEGISFGKVIISAIPIALLTYLESVSVGRKYALVHKYALDMTQELWALGFGCLFASFFQAYPPGGSFSRTALKHEVGVKTPFANIVTSLFVTVVLCAATGLLKYVPQAVLGAVICVAVLSLWDFHDMWRALWVAPVDFLVMAFTFLVTVFWNVELGLEYGIILSVVVLLLQISKLDIDSIGQLNIVMAEEPGRAPGLSKADTHFRPLDRYPAARQHPNVKVLRLRANLFFGNVGAFREEFYASVIESQEQIKAVIIDASGVPEMDLAALAVVDELITEMAKQDVEVFIASASPRVAKSLEAYDLLDVVGGLPLVTLDVEDVFWAVLEDLALDRAPLGDEPTPKSGRPRSNSASLALAEHRALQSGGSLGLKKEGSGVAAEDSKLPV